MTSIHIKNGNIIDPAVNRNEIADLFIDDGTIVDQLTQPADHVIDASGLWVVPGLIDAHVHLREPGGEHKETIETGVAAAAAGGFSQIVAMPNTNPTADCPEVLRFVMDKAAALKSTKVIQSCAITRDRKGQQLVNFREIVTETGVRIFTDDGDGVSSDTLMANALKQAAQLDVILCQHAEYASISKKAPIHDGEVSKAINVIGQPIQSEDNMVFRDIKLAEQTNAKVHVSHISSASAIEAVRQAKKKGIPITAEVTPHHLHLTDETVYDAGTIAKVAPPLRPWTHLEACREGLADGTIDIVATDHAPHTIEDKSGTIDSAAFGMVGLEIAVPMLLHLVKQNLLTPMRMISAMSTQPARIFQLEGGTLTSGTVADVTLIHPDKPFEIDPRTFKSKGINTPFAGAQSPGKAVLTIVNGRVVFSEIDYS